MLPKALFLSTIEKIRQQEARIDEFDKALSKMCDGFPAFDKDNLYLLALRDLLKYTMQDQYDNIGWWLYEAPDAGYTVSWEEAGKEVSVDLTEAGAIEARTMADMLRRQILPAVSAVTAELCERGWKKEQMGVSHKADDAVAREMGQLTDKLYAATEKMERDLSKIPADAKKAMAYSHDHLIPDMEKARELADRLEELTPAERWPFPVYSDLLFSV